jgi:predicted transcriptional regulator
MIKTGQFRNLFWSKIDHTAIPKHYLDRISKMIATTMITTATGIQYWT